MNCDCTLEWAKLNECDRAILSIVSNRVYVSKSMKTREKANNFEIHKTKSAFNE